MKQRVTIDASTESGLQTGLWCLIHGWKMVKTDGRFITFEESK